MTAQVKVLLLKTRHPVSFESRVGLMLSEGRIIPSATGLSWCHVAVNQEQDYDSPPMMVVTPFSPRPARTSAMAKVPLENFSNSKTPMGPFQMTVWLLEMTSPKDLTESGPISRPCTFEKRTLHYVAHVLPSLYLAKADKFTSYAIMLASSGLHHLAHVPLMAAAGTVVNASSRGDASWMFLQGYMQGYRDSETHLVNGSVLTAFSNRC